ncbi:MAG: sulfotransferase family protein [Bacteroidales bacterium]|nr:sulfotransferase family protein [Bacteroidales bacterium]
MPLFVNNKLLFIHIPRTGGTSIEKFLESKGDTANLFTATGAIFINGHTPQHCTFRELEDLGFISDDVRIFSILRNPINRAISDYFYFRDHRPDIFDLFKNFTGFLDLYLDPENYPLFDNHNLSNYEYLADHTGIISEKITIFKFFNIPEIEKFLGFEGLGRFNHYKTAKGNLEINKRNLKRMKNYFSEDFNLFDYAGE